MRKQRVIVVGAGVGGLVAALEIAATGVEVLVLERAAEPGGKMRAVTVGGRRMDAGPTVFTMRAVFEDIFNRAGASLADHLTLQPLEVIARHAWSARERLDLYADRDRSAAAIERFSGTRDAQGYLDFCAKAQRVYSALDHSFIRAPRPGSPLTLMRRIGFKKLATLWNVQPYRSLWRQVASQFHDPRLRQLFGRYATYCGYRRSLRRQR